MTRELKVHVSKWDSVDSCATRCGQTADIVRVATRVYPKTVTCLRCLDLVSAKELASFEGKKIPRKAPRYHSSTKKAILKAKPVNLTGDAKNLYAIRFTAKLPVVAATHAAATDLVRCAFEDGDLGSIRVNIESDGIVLSLEDIKNHGFCEDQIPLFDDWNLGEDLLTLRDLVGPPLEETEWHGDTYVIIPDAQGNPRMRKKKL